MTGGRRYVQALRLKAPRRFAVSGYQPPVAKPKKLGEQVEPMLGM